MGKTHVRLSIHLALRFLSVVRKIRWSTSPAHPFAHIAVELDANFILAGINVRRSNFRCRFDDVDTGL